MILSRIFKKKPIDPPQPIIIVEKVIEKIENEPPQQLQVHEFFSKVENPIATFKNGIEEVKNHFAKGTQDKEQYSAYDEALSTLTNFYECIVLLGEGKASKIIDDKKKNQIVYETLKAESDAGIDSFCKFFFLGDWGLLNTLYTETLEKIMLLYLEKASFKKYEYVSKSYNYPLSINIHVTRTLAETCNGTVFDYVIDNGIYEFSEDGFANLFHFPYQQPKILKLIDVYSSFYSIKTHESWMEKLERDWRHENDYSLLQKFLSNAIAAGNKEGYVYLITELNVEPFHKHLKRIEERRHLDKDLQEFYQFYESYKLSKSLEENLDGKKTTKGGKLKI